MPVSVWERVGASTWRTVPCDDVPTGSLGEDKFFKVRRGGQTATDFYHTPYDYFLHAKQRGFEVSEDTISYAVEKWTARTQMSPAGATTWEQHGFDAQRDSDDETATEAAALLATDDDDIDTHDDADVIFASSC